MFLEYLEIDDSRYFVLFQRAIFVKMNSITGNIEKSRVINRIPQVGQFTKLFYYKGKILFIPLHSKDFVIYDEDRDEIRSLGIPQKEIAKRPFGYFSMAIQRGRYVYAFGISYPGIVKVDMQSEEAQCICELEKEGIKDKGFSGEMIEPNGKVCIPFDKDARLALFDVDKESIEVLSPCVESECFIKTVCGKDDSLILIMNDGTVYEYNYPKATISRIPDLELLLKGSTSIRHGVNYDDKVFLFPEKGNHVLGYSFKKERGMWYNCPIDNQELLCFYYVCSKKDRLTFYNEDTNRLFALNEERKSFEISNIQLSDANYMRLLSEVSKSFDENKDVSLDMFISLICDVS